MSGPTAKGGENKCSEGDGDVLVERVEEDHRHAAVVPAPVYEKKPTEKTKLRDGVVACVHSLERLE